MIRKTICFKKTQVFRSKKPLDNMLSENFYRRWLGPEFFCVKFQDIPAAMSTEATLALFGLHFFADFYDLALVGFRSTNPADTKRC